MSEIDRYNIKLLSPMFLSWKPAKEPSRQIAVLLSGGVDSSTTAYLLKKSGYDVLGITMQIPATHCAGSQSCCGTEAAFVCKDLQIPHYFVDVTQAFQKLIIDRFRQSYAAGQTPNPCVDCNSLLKFSLVWDLIETEFGITHLATGHYGLIIRKNGQSYLARAKDKSKDQSYFLCGLPKERLDRFHLPLGELTKQQVREMASGAGLRVAERSESMELCFAGEDDYRLALDSDQAEDEGDIIDMQGNKIGTHKGISNYTIGQRRGIGFAGGEPLYVGKIDPEKNTIALGTREQVSSSVVKANQINTLIPDELKPSEVLFGKIRSYGDPAPCRVIKVNADEVIVEFDKPQFALTPGQKLVLYNEDDYVVGGGTIIAA